MEENNTGSQKQRLAVVFNALAPTYDQLRFLQVSAKRLIEVAGIREGARLLDVATGTGVIALAAASLVGPGGKVVGIDLSPEMLARAKEKLAQAGNANVEFMEGDTERLEFPDSSFDIVVCSSSLFFVPDMAAAVREWRRVLVPGGRVAFSGYRTTMLQPLRDLWAARLAKYGAAQGVLPIHRLGDKAACESLLRNAGFSAIEVQSEQLGYYLPSAEDRWADIVAGLEGKPLLKLTPDQQEQIRIEHIAELDVLASPAGIWVDVPTLFATARK